jgi:hypothetical protein
MARGRTALKPDSYSVGRVHNAHGQCAVKVVVVAQLSGQDVRRMTRAVEHLLDVTGASAVCCDLGAAEADLWTVDAIARIALVARRHGAHVSIIESSAAVMALLDAVGLRDVVGADGSGS